MFSEASVPALLFMPVPNLLNTSVMSFRCWCVWSAGFCITASSVRFLCIEVGRFFQYAWGRRKSNPACRFCFLEVRKKHVPHFWTTNHPEFGRILPPLCSAYNWFWTSSSEFGTNDEPRAAVIAGCRCYSLTLQRKFLDSVVRIAISKGHWLLFAWPLSQCTQER